ncbi:Hypothetical predicted protein [Paramuricea clavata]|uniref:Uncharacterized protein n=1 Tax=Paramuricea clavata TaxID=317549 RepID=A0A6S7I3Q8_PARCT|nr:Hypothetical predicted protein [Paramuricea clavata]
MSETRFAEEGQLRELKAGYTFFWSGRGKDERRESGGGFAIKNDLIGKLTSLPKGVNDRLMTLTLQLKGKRYATIVSCYASTMTSPDDIKDKFYEELDTIIASTPKQDKLVVLGDFNTRVGSDVEAWGEVIEKHGVRSCNSNGLLLRFTGLWLIMEKFGCPPRFITMIRQFHDGMQAHVLDDGNQSSPFEVTNGVKQGCVLAPMLFSMMFTAMLAYAFSESDPDIDIRYRTDGGSSTCSA